MMKKIQVNVSENKYRMFEVIDRLPELESLEDLKKKLTLILMKDVSKYIATYTLTLSSQTMKYTTTTFTSLRCLIFLTMRQEKM